MDSDSEESKYLLILAAFRRLIASWQDSAEKWETIEEIITLRVSSLLESVLTGLKLDFDGALALLRNKNAFVSLRDKEQRDVLVAAIDNLVDFAAAQENTMLGELPEEIDFRYPERYEDLCEKYNKTYARQENIDVLYAAAVAAWWMDIPSETLVTYMTQGDERVRAWHLSLEGTTYPKCEFPPALIPPIEFGCRCFLITEGSASRIKAVLDTTSKEKEQMKTNPVFKESLAVKGKIFSREHPYFKHTLPLQVQDIVKRIKEKLYL